MNTATKSKPVVMVSVYLAPVNQCSLDIEVLMFCHTAASVRLYSLGQFVFADSMSKTQSDLTPAQVGQILI